MGTANAGGVEDPRYLERRRKLLPFFCVENREPAEALRSLSPTQRYSLEVSRYATGQNTWACSRGIVQRTTDELLIAEVKRNFDYFWHAWVVHPNGTEYLLCGEDYQGYTVINLDSGISHVFFPEEAYAGGGFCWAAVYPSPDGQVLAVEGCYWACPYELVFYDFRHPDTVPLPELARVFDLWEIKGWDGRELVATTLIGPEDAAAPEDVEEASQFTGLATRELRVPAPLVLPDA